MQPQKPKSLTTLRKNIDSIDKKLLSLIEKRQACCKKIGLVKKKFGLPISQPAREKLILDRILKLAKKKSLDQNLIKNLFKLLFAASKKAQLSKCDQ